MSDIKRLFFDLEVSGNLGWFWECGFKKTITPDCIEKERAIICVCWKWEGKKKVYSMGWDWKDGFGCDKRIVQKLAEIMGEADEIVAHFGDSFDVKWMKGRNFLHRLDPLPVYKTYDTCRVARKHFKLNSYKLDYICQKLFNKGKDKADYDMWKLVSRGNDQASMRRMIKYCKQDVLLLEMLYHEETKYEPPHIHAGVAAGKDRWTCHHCASEDVSLSKTRTTAKGMKHRQMQCKKCRRYYSIVNRLYKDYLEAKEGKGNASDE